MKGNKKYLLQLEKLLDLPVWRLKQSGRWLTKHLSHAIKHLPDKEELIFKVFKNSVAMLFMIKRSPSFKKKILSMLGSLPKSKWTIFLDNLNTLKNQNSLVIELLQILLQELISREKVCQPFWNPAYKDVSENLWLPTGTDFVGLDSTLLNNWSQKQEVKLQFLKIVTTKLQNKNSQKTFCPSSMSFLVDKWENEAMPIVKIKTLKIKIYPTTKQKTLIDQFINTSRFVYNRTLEHINKGHKINFIDLRDLLVTENSKKGLEEYKSYDIFINELRKQKKETKDDNEKKIIDEKIKEIHQMRRDKMKEFDYSKNFLIHSFETETPKDIRACAVKRCCDAFKTGFSNLRNGNIKFFNMQFKKKTEQKQTIELTPKIISIQNDNIKIAPEFFKDDCILKIDKHNKRKIKNLKIENNVDIVRSNQGYYLYLSIKTEPKGCDKLDIVAGVDLGIRTFATVHSNKISSNDTTITEYKHRSDLLKKLNQKINLLKNIKGRIRKKQINKIEKEKRDLVDRLHWNFINDLLSHNDVIYLGDIKSHDIVKNGKNKSLNVAFNDLKFYQLKQKLLYKAFVKGKKVFFVHEHYTTKTCSCCGVINEHVGCKEVFECSNCKLVTGRDMNASKNIKMKGFFI